MQRGSGVCGSVPDSPAHARRSAPTNAGAASVDESCTILHVDMDAFFASVEVLDDPQLAGKPVIVGGSGARGVVASCTYEARVYGIHSAMASSEARRRCPHAIFVAGRYDRYAQMSERLHVVLNMFTPVVEGLGLDEAFLDVSGATRLLGSPLTIAHDIRAMVLEELRLDCCVGVARTKLLAKLASRAAKPRARPGGIVAGTGVFVVYPESEVSFLHPLPVGALWGVGPATRRRLESIGVTTVGELASMPEAVLCRAIGTAAGRQLSRMARGDDDRAVEAERETKSVGHEETFATDLHVHGELHHHVARMADAVATRLRAAGLRGRTISLKVRYADRRTITRSQTLASPSDSLRAIAAVAAALLDAVEVSEGVRLIGVSVSSLQRGVGSVQQLTFESFCERGSGTEAGRDQASPESLEEGDAARRDAWEEVEAAVNEVRARYGRSAVGSAALVGADGIAVKRPGDAQWGPGDPALPVS